MKTKTLLSILALGLIVSAFGQKPTMELTFTAENSGQYVPLDSILVENLTQGVDTTLYSPDTVLVLDYITSIGNNQAIGENTFSVSQNYPNPFKEKTEVDLFLPEKEYITITVRDILARELTRYEKNLSPGNHSFSFYPGNEQCYFLTVTDKQTSQTIKMLNATVNAINGGKCKIVYNKFNDNVTGFKSKAINEFGFNPGDELKYIGYTDVEVSEFNDAPMGSQTYTFQFNGWTPCPGMSTVTDIDGNIYNTVQIGDQCWMKENLKTITYQNGTVIPNGTDNDAWANLTVGAYFWYDNDKFWKDSYGALYNWYAVVDTNGLCPTGWHVSTNDEWTVLADFIGGPGSPHGNELKSCRQVNSPLGGGCNTNEHPRWEDPENGEYGTDDYGFSGLPGGGLSSGFFYYIGYGGYWWSSTESSTYYAWYRYLTCDASNLHVGVIVKQSGGSIRCLRD